MCMKTLEHRDAEKGDALVPCLTCVLSCRFGFDVPVILRSSDEVESLLVTPEKQMVQVRNPFSLEMRSGPASVTGEDKNITAT